MYVIATNKLVSNSPAFLRLLFSRLLGLKEVPRMRQSGKEGHCCALNRKCTLLVLFLSSEEVGTFWTLKSFVLLKDETNTLKSNTEFPHFTYYNFEDS